MSICTSLDLYFKMGPPMSENQLKESQSRVVSHLRLGGRWGVTRSMMAQAHFPIIFGVMHF